MGEHGPVNRQQILAALIAGIALQGVCSLALTGAITQTTMTETVAFTGVNVVDIEFGGVRPNQTIVVSAATGRIVEIAAGATTKLQPTRSVAATGKFVIPGLWDMHVHTLQPNRESYLAMFIANGVTGVRDMGTSLSNLAQAHAWRRETRDRKRIAPRIYASGPLLGGAQPQNALPVGSAAEARAAVQTLKSDGADFVKVYSLLSRPAFLAVLDEAKKQQLDVVGHVPLSVTAAEASDAGQKSMEHSYGLLESCSTHESELRKEVERAAGNPDTWAAWGAVVRTTDRLYGAQARDQSYSKEKCEALFARFVRNGTWQCPTLVLRRAFALRDDLVFTNDPRMKALPPSVTDAWRNSQADTRNSELSADELRDRRIRLAGESELTGDMHRAGVGILAGTDLGNPYLYPGSSLHDELALLTRAGLSALDALRTATLNPARFFGLSDTFGTVAQGKVADLVLLDANPLDDIANTQRIYGVVANGRYFARAELDALQRRVQ
jgi:imidazolonepropionase-like amidohydrolase